MYLGLDIGTSGVKAVLMDPEGVVTAQADAGLTVSRPQPLWSEQQPRDWWHAVNTAVADLKQTAPAALAETRAIGLSGQMHGAVLLDHAGQVLRPAILWNDGRSGDQCRTLERREPRTAELTGNLAMPGFTAPKLLWVAAHESEIFRAVDKVLLPKDYIRYCMTGGFVAEMSDAAGTLWLDTGARAWSEPMLSASGLNRDQMPDLVEGAHVSGTLKSDVAAAWGVRAGIPVAGGGGDNAAGAVGIGAVTPGRAFLSLGTSGVYFLCDDGYHPNPAGGVHTFCHALPGLWHRMSVVLSAASCVDWVARLTGLGSAERAVNAVGALTDPVPGGVMFLPYLSGERTPHNDPHAKGVFFGMTHRTGPLDLVRAVLEGVGFALADGQAALTGSGARIGTVSVIGGGARNLNWGRALASILDRSLTYHADSAIGPALGAARLARLAETGESLADVCPPPPVTRVIEPDPSRRDAYADRFGRYQDLYQRLKTGFAAGEI